MNITACGADIALWCVCVLQADVFSFGIIMYEVLQRYIVLSAVAVAGTYEELEGYCARVAGGYRPPLHAKWPVSVAKLIQVRPSCNSALTPDGTCGTAAPHLQALLWPGRQDRHTRSDWVCSGNSPSDHPHLQPCHVLLHCLTMISRIGVCVPAAGLLGRRALGTPQHGRGGHSPGGHPGVRGDGGTGQGGAQVQLHHLLKHAHTTLTCQAGRE